MTVSVPKRKRVHRSSTQAPFSELLLYRYTPIRLRGQRCPVATVSAINHAQHTRNLHPNVPKLTQSSRTSPILLMSLSFGGLGLISLWTPLYFWDDSTQARSEFRSFVFALVFVAVVLILGESRCPSSFLALTDHFFSFASPYIHRSRHLISPSDIPRLDLRISSISHKSFRDFISRIPH